MEDDLHIKKKTSDNEEIDENTYQIIDTNSKSVKNVICIELINNNKLYNSWN